MADRQRSFADMFPDVLGSMTRGAEWKEAMRPRTKKEMARQLTQEDRKWLKEREQQGWLDRRLNLLGPQDPAIAPQVLDYMMKLDPRRSMMKGFQKFILPKLSKMTRRRQKRQMKEAGETRKSPDEYQVGEGVYRLPTMEDLEKHEQVSDRMGYNPTDWYVGEPRSPEDHAQDLAVRFHQYLRDMDVREATADTARDRPDPDRDMSSLVDYMRWVARRGQRASERQEAGLPRIRGETERFQQADRAMQKRYESLTDAVIDRLPSDFDFRNLDEQSSKPSQSILDLLSRTMGRKLSRDKPSTNR